MTKAQNPATRPTAIAADLADASEDRVQVCYRISRDDRDALHRLALDRRTSLQRLLDEAVGDLRAKFQSDS